MQRPEFTPVKLSRSCPISSDYRILKNHCGKAIWERIPSKLKSPEFNSVTEAIRSVIRTENRIYPPQILEIVTHQGGPWVVMEHFIGFDNAVLAINLKSAKIKRLPADSFNRAKNTNQSPYQTLFWLNQLAIQGKPFAMYWLGEWHYDSNVPKSIWYHAAAARRVPEKYMATLQHAVTGLDGLVYYDNMPDPCLNFLGQIKELTTGKVEGCWKDAIYQAGKAVHHPANPPPIKKVHASHSGKRLFHSVIRPKYHPLQDA